MTLVIEGGVPIPRRRVSRVNYDDYPFARMKVGDSFSLNGCGKMPCTIGYLAAVFGRGQAPPWRFIVRKTENGHRCWRVL